MSIIHIETKRQKLSEERGGEFVGYNDPKLSDLVPHNLDEPHGTSGTENGFAFGGRAFPDSQAAERIYLPKAEVAQKN